VNWHHIGVADPTIKRSARKQQIRECGGNGLRQVLFMPRSPETNMACSSLRLNNYANLRLREFTDSLLVCQPFCRFVIDCETEKVQIAYSSLRKSNLLSGAHD
jgi:hypothetical protein